MWPSQDTPAGLWVDFTAVAVATVRSTPDYNPAHRKHAKKDIYKHQIPIKSGGNDDLAASLCVCEDIMAA